MKLLKKLITFILTFILTGLIVLLIITCTIKETIVNDILYESMKSTIFQKSYKEANVTLDDIITEDGVITDNEFVNEILESKEVKELVNNYIDKIIEVLAEEDKSLEELNEFDLEQDMINYIKENKEVLSKKTGIEITDEMIDKASEKLDEKDTKKVVKQAISNARNNLTTEEKKVLKMYKVITSTKIKIFTLLAILLNVFLIALVKKSYYKWIKNLSYSMILGGLGTVVISMMLKILLQSIMHNPEITIKSMMNISIIVLVFGLIIYIIYLIVDKFFIKGDENEVSKVLE